MDPVAAARHLTEYWALIQEAQKQPFWTTERRAKVRELNRRLPSVNEILRALAPDIPLITAYGLGDHVAARPTIRRALTLLGSWQGMISDAGSGGGPAVFLSWLDPVISQAARPLWDTGKYRQAVSDAATSLNSYAQDRIGRHDISDKDLMAQAFSDKAPEQGKARLRCPGDPSSETVRSQQEGARALAIGAFQVVRNPAHHLTGDWNPITAFHHLTTLSQVGQWFRYWNVECYQAPLPDLSALLIDTTNSPVQRQMIKAVAQMQPPASARPTGKQPGAK